MPNTSVAPTPVSARMAPVIRPLSVSWASCCSIVLRSPSGPAGRGGAGLNGDRLDDGGRAVRLVLPDVVSERVDPAVGGEVQGPGGADEVDLLAVQHRLDRLVELLERVGRAGIGRDRHDVLADLGRLGRLRLE